MHHLFDISQPRPRLWLAGLALLIAFSSVAAHAQAPVQEQDLFKYLDQSISWYRGVTATDPSQISSREVIFNNNLKQSALKTLRLSFDFARIQAELLQTEEAAQKKAEEKKAEEAAKQNPPVPLTPPVVTEAESGNDDKEPDMVRVAGLIAAKITRIENDIQTTQTDLTRARGNARETLQAKRDKLDVELTLANAQKELVDTIIASANADNEEETVAEQIANLAKAIPELDKKKKSSAVSATAATTSPNIAPDKASSAAQMVLPIGLLAFSQPSPDGKGKDTESKGIVGLIGDAVDLSHQKESLADLAQQTKAMTGLHDDMLARIRANLLVVVRRGNSLGQDNAGEGAQSFALQREELMELIAQFKQLSQVMVPLSQQKKPLADSLKTIDEWQKLFSAERGEVLRRLGIHLIGLVIALAIPLILSEFARRANLKYVHDMRRRRQLNIIRRIILSILIGFIIILNLMTEFGSLATFVGFVTAGLAVALQNVILSIVAYFFFFGRYGIRVGSRVTVYGTTGEVIETGLVRLYLMELTEEDDKWQPTGRIVAFPNSILFQPTAFFKQVPGVRFQQHEVSFAIDPEADRAVLKEKLAEAAKAIYDDSRAILQAQRITLEQNSHIKARIPRPKGALRDMGDRLEFVMRYPIASDRADNIDENVKRIIDETLEREPKISRRRDDEPKIRKH